MLFSTSGLLGMTVWEVDCSSEKSRAWRRLRTDLVAHSAWWRPWSPLQSWRRDIRKWLRLWGSSAAGSSRLSRSRHQTLLPAWREERNCEETLLLFFSSLQQHCWGFISWPDCRGKFHFFSFFFVTIENDCWDVALSNILSGRRHPEEVHKALWGSHATKLPCKIPMPSVILPEVCDLQLPGCVCNGVWTAALGAHWECWRWRHCWHGKLPLATEAEL